MQISSLLPTELFVRTSSGEAQLLAVTLSDVDPAARITVTSAGAVVGTAAAADHVDVPLDGLIGRTVGETVELDVSAGAARASVRLQITEPGWTVWMIPHFHYDPVWWNTQAAYTATWDELEGQAQEFRMAFQQTGFALVDAHLAVARRDPDYKFVLAEVDYLRPYWDARPHERAYIRRLLADGRLEIMGGTYNEPNTNLTTAETTARNFVYGDGFQRQLVGADPHTAWQLDVFGHDPQFPGMAADAGLSSSSWARGPHHQWGPMLTRPGPDEVTGWGDPSVMQFPAEFDWVSPSGRGVLTHYMPAHYSAGWQIDSRATLSDAEQAVYELFVLLKRVAATHNVLLPVGTDWTPPSKWVTEIQRDWNARYSSPRFRCALPREFFAAVRSELDERRRRPTPQTRDMNPIYTGKDVSYIDTKQAQRAAESLLVDAEMFATFAALHGARYPHAAIDKAWRQLVYGAHHDAITGSESDQVYLDLLTSWREAHCVGRTVLRASIEHLAAQLDIVAVAEATTVAVFNPSTWDRRDTVTVSVTDVAAPALEVVGPDARPVPSVVDNASVRDEGTIAAADVTFVADAPGIGHRAGWQIRPADAPSGGWLRQSGRTSIESERYLVEVDPARGGSVRRLFDKACHREVLRAGELGNELLLVHEYAAHPEFHEGPWHLVPTGDIVQRSSAAEATSVTVETSPLGERVIVTGTLREIRYTQRLTLWHHLERIECSTTLDGFEGENHMVRVRWPADVPGALPVSDVGNAVIGRGFGFPETDAAEHPWTLDNPALNWFALSSTARVRVSAGNGDSAVERAIGVAELIAPDAEVAGRLRPLAVALAGQGVTATTSIGVGSRYGRLAVDSNLPDVRITVGGPQENRFTAAVLDAADEQYRIELDKQLAANGTARVWVPAARALRDVWQPSADLTGAADLPVLIVVGDDEVAALVADLGDAVIDVAQVADAATQGEPALDDYTVAVLNTGMPSFDIDTSGNLTMSILRSCTGWPSGVWINPPRRTAPDGSNFQQQHWTHHYDYALVTGAGDWRATDLVRAGHELNHRLHAARVGGGGELPSEMRHLAIDGTSDLLVTAVKASGNPLASGHRPGRLDAVTVRLAEMRGRTASCAVQPSFASRRMQSVDLLERSRGGADLAGGRIDFTPMQVQTLQLSVDVPEGTAQLADDREPHQPAYSRYWLNNTGPAPRGNLPMTVHAEPPLVEWSRGAIELTVRVSSDSAVAADVPVHIVVPAGWRAEPSELQTSVQPGEFTEHAVRVSPAPDAVDGSWWIRTQAHIGGQLIEDVTRVLVGTVGDPELSVALSGPPALSPGEVGSVDVRIGSTARSPISAQVQLISPWHTWDLLPHWDTGAAIAPGEEAVVSVPVQVPIGAEPGTWWVLVKVAAAGALHYSEPIALEVRPR
jgi:alpha-mannosidase